MSIISNLSQDLPFWVALSTFDKFGAKRFDLLDKYFPSMELAFNASVNELMEAGISKKIVEEFIEHRKKITPEEEMDKLQKENIKVITIKNDKYPKLLKEIYDPPSLLYYKGNWPDNTNFCLAVVGSRKYTSYGQQAVEHLTSRLAQANLIIVSGLALGIDALAHVACVKAGGTTIAVLGSGLDKNNIYPASNRYVAEQILDNNGLIITEYPISTPPLHYHFPQRNRIISGLSLGTLVIEASIKSGASITAKLALEQGREVFAVPGNIFSSNSEGTNKLIREGAQPAVSAEVILEALSLENINNFVEAQKLVPQTPEEEKILTSLSRESIHVNQLARQTKLDTGTINATLLTMELKGYVRNLGGSNYVLA